MKKKKITIIITSVLIILAAAALVYFKVILPKNKTKQIATTGMGNMKMDSKDGKEKMNAAGGSMDKNNSTHDVSLHTLMQPANGYAISSIPATTLIQREEPIEINAIGYTAYNTNEVGAISTRVNGRIEKLYVKYRYQLIKKGQKIMDIYSPELLTAQQNHLFLLKNDAANYSLINASREKLLLLGFPAEQLQQLTKTQKPLLTVSVYSRYSGHIHDALNKEMSKDAQVSPSMNEAISLTTQELSLKEGMYLQKGQTVFKVYNANKIWALLNIYSSDQVFIKTGNRVTLVPEAKPEKIYNSAVNFIEPFFRPGNKTLTARVNIDNSILQLPIGSQVKATIFSSPVFAAWLPREAIVSLGFEKIVFVKSNNGYKAQKVTIGVTNKNLIQVTGGITAADSVAVNAQFLMDSESFIKVKE
jgi:membrane fusion protein, copper/silver efflux system